MTNIKPMAQLLLATFAATAMSAAPLGAQATNRAPKNLDVNFTISGTTGFDGT
jgi:hypothetical protein